MLLNVMATHGVFILPKIKEVAGMARMIKTKFGLVSRTEACCLGELEQQLTASGWIRNHDDRVSHVLRCGEEVILLTKP